MPFKKIAFITGVTGQNEGSPWIDTVKLDSWTSRRNAALGVGA